MRQNLEQHIAELLELYDCVVVPEFGGFVANYQGAKVDSKQHLFHPPSKAISFNSNLLHNDGLLANQLVVNEELTYETALSNIREFVLDCKVRLERGERIPIQGIGHLYYGAERNIRFEAQQSNNFLAEGFGLKAFHVPPIEQEPVIVTEEKAIPLAHQEKTVVDKPLVKPLIEKDKDAVRVLVLDAPVQKRRWPLTAAASVLLLTSFYSYWIPNHTSYQEENRLELAHFFEFGKQNIPAQYQVRPQVETAITDPNEGVAWDDAMQESETPTTTQSKVVAKVDSTYVAPKTPVAIPTKKYQIIGGCFKAKTNAEKQVENLITQGYEASILDQSKGLYRVTMGGFDSRSAAKRIYKKAKSNGLKSWILKQK